MPFARTIGVLAACSLAAWIASVTLYGSEAINRTYPFKDGLYIGACVVIADSVWKKLSGRKPNATTICVIAALFTFVLYALWLIVLMG